ncbi:E3 ubiquitin-protein ligase KEG isoform X2 [Mangifera indica]|nr:E3 ubiquitin-protein ligase KEG isoform X2 [Mangifera indica]XP_044463957.1 E3 ubiquitin-protein ligase KEG isoform X2 [Mangifera indica]XP_044463958.1 E3 ubiquitin-protein ligase KEG isoform X2 [Mangifera indica]
MAGKVAAAPLSAFEYELFEGHDYLGTVVAASKETTMWIDPTTLKLRHRIGRGPFGETWLATLHRSTEDYDEYHEVAVKVLHPIKEDHMRVMLGKLDDLFSKCQGVEGVCCLQGISVMNGKICLVMKFYEGSVGDKMALLKGGKLSLSNAFRYIISLAQGILELHSKEILILNLKPFNFLLNESNEAVVGDLGIPYILLGIPLPSSDLARRIGTPNYMAPEQWQPEVRGPISFETDSWGFACSIVEMLTGVQPWCGKSVDEIYDAVVEKQEKPCIPIGLPPPIENVLLGCFEYDFRSRPLMTDILRVFKSLQNAVNSGGWTGLASVIPAEKTISGYTDCFLSKNDLQVGDMVRSRKPANSCKPENMDVPEGTVVGLERSTERDCFVLVRIHGIHDPLRVHISSLERVTYGLAAGDWVRMKEEDKRHSPVGVLHSVHRDGNVAVGFIGSETIWKGKYSELQMAESYSIGQFVRLKGNLLSPRFQWPRKTGGGWATGRIFWVLPNGCLVVKFPGRLTFGEDCSSSFLADPAEVEVVTFSTCPGMVKKYQHLEDHHWVVRPLLIVLGLFTAMKMGIFIGRKVRRGSKVKKQPNNVMNIQHIDGQTTGNPGWLPPSLANILFKGVDLN